MQQEVYRMSHFITLLLEALATFLAEKIFLITGLRVLSVLVSHGTVAVNLCAQYQDLKPAAAKWTFTAGFVWTNNLHRIYNIRLTMTSNWEKQKIFRSKNLTWTDHLDHSATVC